LAAKVVCGMPSEGPFQIKRKRRKEKWKVIGAFKGRKKRTRHSRKGAGHAKEQTALGLDRGRGIKRVEVKITIGVSGEPFQRRAAIRRRSFPIIACVLLTCADLGGNRGEGRRGWFV